MPWFGAPHSLRNPDVVALFQSGNTTFAAFHRIVHPVDVFLHVPESLRLNHVPPGDHRLQSLFQAGLVKGAVWVLVSLPTNRGSVIKKVCCIWSKLGLCLVLTPVLNGVSLSPLFDLEKVISVFQRAPSVFMDFFLGTARFWTNWTNMLSFCGYLAVIFRKWSFSQIFHAIACIPHVHAVRVNLGVIVSTLNILRDGGDHCWETFNLMDSKNRVLGNNVH